MNAFARIRPKGGQNPTPLAFFPGVCSGGYLFSSGGPTPPPPIFTLSITKDKYYYCYTVVDRAALPHRRPRISESCLSQPAWTTTAKRREKKTEFTYTQL